VSTTGALTNSGFVSLEGTGSTLSIAGALTNSGVLAVAFYFGGGASTLSIGGTLTNTGTLGMGNNNLVGSVSVTAKSLVNSGTVDLIGVGTNFAALNVSGATTNNGSISVASDTEELAGAVGRCRILQPLDSQSSVRLEGYGGADHQRERRGRAYSRAGAVLRRHDLRFRDWRHDRRGELSLSASNDVQFRREFGEHGRHANADRQGSGSDRQNPNDRRLLELEFHPRPRQRDRHAGEVRLSPRRRGNQGEETHHEHIDMDWRRQFGLGRRRQLEPGRRTGRELGRRDSHRVPVASASIGTVNSITDSSDLSFESAGTNTVATFLDDTGHLYVDHGAGEGGTILNIGGALTNSGRLRVGSATLSASDEVTAASLDNTGSIYVYGSSVNQALLDVSGAAGFGTAGVLSGYVRLYGDSAIEFGSGEITSLAAGAHLRLNGNDSFVEDSTALGKNIALIRLASIGLGASLSLHDGAAVSTNGALVNDGTIRLDFVDGDGGSNLTLAGALTNSGDVVIGNTTLSASDKVTAASLNNTGHIGLAGSAANQALLDVTTHVAGFGAAGVLTGVVQLFNDSAIEFRSGQISRIATGGLLYLDGSNASIEDSTAPGSNSALTGLASIGVGATLDLENKAAVSTTGALVNDGNVNLDRLSGNGGSSLTLAGALTNSHDLVIGNATLSASDKVTATALDNTGLINLIGSGTNQALLDVAGSAGFGTAGVLSGYVQLAGDSAIEFAGEQITSLAANAQLHLNGSDAVIEDSTALGSNSALTGLASISSGATFTLANCASVSTVGALTNNGSISMNEADGGSSLTVGGTLTNNGTVVELVRTTTLSDKVTAASLYNAGTFYASGGSTLSIGGALTNTGFLLITGEPHSSSAKSFVNSGTVDLIRNGTNFAALNVSGATTNDGTINIGSDTEELAGAVGGKGSFSLSTANLQFDSSVSTGQTINETGADALTLKQAQNFAATISGFGTGDTIDATNFLAPPQRRSISSRIRQGPAARSR
jgi:hypothetical protein